MTISEANNDAPVPGAARARPLVAGMLAAGLLALAGAAPAAAQAPRPEPACDNLNRLGGAQLQVSQQAGRALVEITRANSGGRKVEIEYGDESYIGRFDKDNRVRMGFALTAPEAEFTIRMSETAPITCKVRVPEFARLFRVIMRWRDPVQLDLHVVEPGRRLGEFGHVSAARPNGNLAQGMGQMDVAGSAPADGATAEMSYVIADASVIAADSVFGYRLDYVTRGASPAAPYCDDHPLASPQIEFITIEKGRVATRKFGTNRAHCGEVISDARRLMVLRQ